MLYVLLLLLFLKGGKQFADHRLNRVHLPKKKLRESTGICLTSLLIGNCFFRVAGAGGWGLTEKLSSDAI